MLFQILHTFSRNWSKYNIMRRFYETSQRSLVKRSTQENKEEPYIIETRDGILPP